MADQAVVLPSSDGFYYTDCMALLAGLMMLAAAIALMWSGVSETETERKPLPKSLRRRPFARDTVEENQFKFLDQQFEQAGVDPANQQQIDAAMLALRDTRRAFHLRHVFADSLIRDMVAVVLRDPTPVSIAKLKNFFSAMGANRLVQFWTQNEWNLCRGVRWDYVLDKSARKTLSNLLSNDIIGNLFYSEKQGNLHIGTHLDLTEEAIVQIGRENVQTLLKAGLEALQALGFAPRIRLIGDEMALGCRDAVSELYWFGYRRREPRDPQINPMSLISYADSLAILRRTPPMVRFRYMCVVNRDFVVYLLVYACFAYLRRCNWQSVLGFN
jgi:hypothetical protein